MSRKLVILGVIFSVAAGAYVRASDYGMEERDASKGSSPSTSSSSSTTGKEPEKKPNIVKDYVCFRDGELCHPDFKKNRGKFVACSNGVAWEQECPKCSYHPLTCPTKSLWFDGEKCDWASPKLASQPCIDHFPSRDESAGLSEQDVLLQSLQYAPVPNSAHHVSGQKEQFIYDKSKKPIHQSMGSPSVSAYYKPRDQDEDQFNMHREIDFMVEPAGDEVVNQRNVMQELEDDPDFPSMLQAGESAIGSKIVKLSEPVYTLVDNPDGTGKRVLKRVSSPFVLEDPARSIIPNFNFLPHNYNYISRRRRV